MKICKDLNSHFKLSSVLLLIVVSFFGSCKKSQKQFILHNHFGRVNIDIYKSADFYTGKVYIHGTVDSNQDFVIPASKLEMGGLYYMDCYTDDYTMTNLYSPEPRACTLLPMPDQMEANISLYHSVWRPIIWNKNQLQSRWKAVDAFDNKMSSVWSTLPDSTKFEEVIFNRDQVPISRYIFNQDTGSFLGRALSDERVFWDGTCEINTNAGSLYNYRYYGNPKPMKDTLILFSNRQYNYVMVRE